MPQPKKKILIRLERLVEARACQSQVDLFWRTFGDSVEFTPKNLVKAQEAGLDLGWLAACPTAHPEVLRTLAAWQGLDGAWVRGCVAHNRRTPPDVLASLKDDQERYVRLGLARNPRTPLDVLGALRTDVAEEVRLAAAVNTSWLSHL